jgi:hypothetical protein
MRTDRHYETNSRFSQLCEKRLKINCFRVNFEVKEVKGRNQISRGRNVLIMDENLHTCHLSDTYYCSFDWFDAVSQDNWFQTSGRNIMLSSSKFRDYTVLDPRTLEVECTVFFRNVGNRISGDLALYSKIKESSTSPLRELQDSLASL